MQSMNRIFWAAALAVSFFAREARSDDEATLEARQRFREGVTLYDKGRFEAARVKFKQAYALKKHPDVLLNIGWSALKSGRRGEAHAAFEEYLRSAPDASQDKRAQARQGLEASGDPPLAKSTEGRVADRQTGRPLRVDALAGFTSNYLGATLGVRVGKRVFPRINLGGTFIYHLGHSTSSVVGGVTAESSSSAFYLGPEAGYDFDVGPVLVRPSVGLGLGSFTSRASMLGTPAVSTTATELVFWLGGAGLYDIPDTSFMVGADLRLVLVPYGSALAALVTAGIKL